ncbi:hypothetical protein V502_00398 [Pseudogymnoascus sp. VKM F-4520 (FW-2644)]|nr:hypothetical protein V502_00398 [Pseudogymnoascus sp. VKM F-4520 (FW-2644)]
MQLPPIDVILSWPDANYENPTVVHGPAMIVLTMIFLPLTIAVVIARTFTRIRISKNFGGDDMFILAALVPTIACGIITVVAAFKYGWNRHVYDVPFEQLVLGLKLVVVVECLFAIGCSLTKLSLLIFTQRIMAGTNPSLRMVVIGTMAVVGLEMIIFCFVVIFTCSPASDYWTLSATPQKCINETAHLLAGGIINTITDFLVVMLPIPTVLALKLPTRQRIILIFLFGAGFAVCIAGSVRVYYTYYLNTSYDKTWAAYPVWISGTIELYLGVIAASLASIKPLFARYLPTIFGTGTSQRVATSTSFSTSNARRADFRRLNGPDASKDGLPSGTTAAMTTFVHAGRGDVELGDVDVRKGGLKVVVSKFLEYGEDKGGSKFSLGSVDTSETDLRWGRK